MPPDFITPLTQFGTAGLIAWMWLTERRAAGARERELHEAHQDIRRQRLELDQLLAVVSSNTRALSALESSQRRLAELLERLAAPCAAPAPARRTDAA